MKIAWMFLVFALFISTACGQDALPVDDTDAGVAPDAMPFNMKFYADSPTINFGESTELIWKTTGASRCQAVSDNWTIDGTDVEGSVTVTPLVSTYYVLACDDQNHPTTAYFAPFVNVRVVQLPPTATLTATYSTITAGQSTTLTWGSTNAIYCLSTWTTGELATSDSAVVTPTENTLYTIACLNGDNDVAYSNLTVTVTQ